MPRPSGVTLYQKSPVLIGLKVLTAMTLSPNKELFKLSKIHLKHSSASCYDKCEH